MLCVFTLVGSNPTVGILKYSYSNSQKTYNHYDDVDLWYYSMRASRPAIYFENHDYSSFDFEDTYDSWQGDDFEDNFFDS